jgi:dolichol-phosphate mannosyltransferase
MISLVIPIYNERDTIPALYDRITSAARDWQCDYEMIAVDDGSTDESFELLSAIHREDPRWNVLRLSRNFGHQAAVSAGIHFSRGDAVAILDADLQDPPEELGRFLDKWREGYQVVYAVRTKRKEGFLKRTAYWLFYRLMKYVSSIDIPLDSGDFCLMDRAVVDVIKSMPERTRFVRGLRSWAGFRQVGLEYERQARHAGEVKYTFPKLVRLAVDGVLSFSNMPLRIASWLGVGLCGAAFLLTFLIGCWWACDVRIGGTRPGDAVGWTSLVGLLLLLSGLQMLLIGLVGEYLSRLFDEVKGRPPWVIAEAMGIDSPTERTPDVGWFVQRPPSEAASIGEDDRSLSGRGPR